MPSQTTIHNLIYSTIKVLRENENTVGKVLEINAKAQGVSLADYMYGICAKEAGTVQEILHDKIVLLDQAFIAAKEKAREILALEYVEKHNLKTLTDEQVKACQEYVEQGIEKGEWIMYFDPRLLVF